jgi:putative mRNA 3-end processing factor
MKTSIVTESPSGLWCPRGGFHIDPWDAVERAVITHAHGDHARPGSAAYLCAAPSAGLLRRRFGSDARIESVEYGETVTLGDVRVSFHPAGHVLGSAQIRLDSNEGVWVIAGDYKRAADPTCAPFDPLRCDTFVTESTFGLPIYRWDETATIVDDIDAWWRANADAGRTSVLFCYTIGKAQRLLAELMRVTDRTIYVHGMMLGMIEAYRACGVSMLPVTPVIEKTGPSTGLRAGRGRSAVASFAGELVLAPLSARGTPWMRRLGDVSDAFASGLMRVRGVRRQRGFDRGFVLSDHADWPALLSTIQETGATRVLATHGYAEPLARYLSERGIEAATIRTAWEGEPSGD